MILWCASLSQLAWLCVCTVVGVAGAAAGCAVAASIHCHQRWAMKQVWAVLLAGGWAGPLAELPLSRACLRLGEGQCRHGPCMPACVLAWQFWHVISGRRWCHTVTYLHMVVDSRSVRSSSSPWYAWRAARLLSQAAAVAWYGRVCTGSACVACCPVHKTQWQAVFCSS